VNAIAIAAGLLALAFASASDPMARFSYSTNLAQQMNTAHGVQPARLFVVDDARGRELGDPHLLDAIQALIRVFPACGSRKLKFTYAYGSDATNNFVAFSQVGDRAPKCPGTALVSLSTVSNAVTVRSFPEA
jgi:hypothetical protein